MWFAIWLPVLVAIVSFASRASAQDDPGGPIDASGSGGVQPVKWEPMIVEFYVAAEHGTSAVVRPQLQVETPAKDARGEAAQWQAIKTLIAPRAASPVRTQAYKPDEPVFSAWQRLIDPNGVVEFLVYGSNSLPGAPALTAGADEKAAPSPGLHTLFSEDNTVLVWCDLDILMNRPAEFKDEKLKKHFKVLQYEITAVKLNDNLDEFRDAVMEQAEIVPIAKVGNKDEKVGFEYEKTAHGLGRKWGGHGKFNYGDRAGKKGVWELRVVARVSGRMDDAQLEEIKTVQGAIRIAFVDARKFEAMKIVYNSIRKHGKDLPPYKGPVLGTPTR
jgi:hypothetical protein